MAIVLGAVGLFLYLRLESDLNGTIDQGLRSRASQLAGLLGSTGRGDRGDVQRVLAGAGESFAQVLTPDGRIFATTAQLAGNPVLSATEARGLKRQTFFDPARLAGVNEPARLLATPAHTASRPLVAVVGSSLADRDDALRSVATLLFIGGPVVLLLASLAAYAASAAALRPVEALRRGAARISATDSDQRLPVPPAHDELRRLAETLNGMLERLGAALDRERRFVDEASHELRTPLALHKIELEVALRYEHDPERLRAAIASAIEEVNRLIGLAEDLLVVARSESGEVVVNAEPIQLGELLASVEERFANRAEGLGRRLVVDAPDGLTVEADSALVERALTNLVDNALRHGDGEVRVRADSTDGRLELHVSDRGPGFPPDFIDHAFERFTRAAAGRPRGGTGLGLAIVDAVARAHGGAAHAENRTGGGSDVWLELPARRS